MTLDEAIKHAKEVAKKQENNAKSYPRPNKSVKGSGRKYNAYLKCAEEHRQLAEWLKELKERREKWEELVEEIQELKRRCNNPTCYEAYETGYYSALSFVEQIISKLKVEE